jgi:hypothetical protein
MEHRRTRWLGFLGMIAAAVLGLASRSPLAHDLPVIGPYGGDAAWATAACAGIRLLLPALSVSATATLGYALSVGVECSQLLHVDWLDAIRAHRLGALLLGRGFLWSDLVAYAGGVAIFALAFKAMEPRDGRGGIAGTGRKAPDSAGRNSPPSG